MGDGQIVAWPVWLGIVAEDFDKQVAFYRDTLGFPLIQEGAGWAWFDAGWPNLLEVIAREDVPQYDRPRYQVAFQVADIRSARAEMISRGVEALDDIDGGPEAAGYWCYFRDAEGNVFAITQRLGPPWPADG